VCFRVAMFETDAILLLNVPSRNTAPQWKFSEIKSTPGDKFAYLVNEFVFSSLFSLFTQTLSSECFATTTRV